MLNLVIMRDTQAQHSMYVRLHELAGLHPHSVHISVQRLHTSIEMGAHLGLTLMRGMVSTTVLVLPGRPECVMVRADICIPAPASGKFADACGPLIALAAASYALAASSSYSKKPRWFT